jgi:hypothetical protein
VYRWRILDDHHVLSLHAAIPELGDGLIGIHQQALLVSGVGPRAGHYLRAVTRTNLVFVRVNQGIERCPVDQSLLNEQRFQRLHSQGRVRRNYLMSMAVGAFMILRMGKISCCRCSRRGGCGRQKIAPSRFQRTPFTALPKNFSDPEEVADWGQLVLDLLS